VEGVVQLENKKIASLALQLDQLLVAARQKLGPDVTVLRLHILLNVYLHEGCSQNELLFLLDVTSVTALSRNLADLSTLTSSKRLGPGLIELRPDTMNLRRKTIHLTRKGRSMVAVILKSVPK
jgi:DNA-binding MarR family transcriptional regulator